MTDLPTRGQAQAQARRTLQHAELPSAARDADVLLTHVCHCDLAQLYAHPETLLTPQQQTQLAQLIQRRAQREPVAYLVGSKEFYGLRFAVDARVLIPRPETELLVDLACQHTQGSTAPRVLDVGCGSGAIAISIAHTCPHADVWACDISADALTFTRQNAALHHVQVQCVRSDLLAAMPSDVWDVLVANLPYLDIANPAMPDVHNFEPQQALYAREQGLESIRLLIAQAADAVRPGGVLLLECGDDQALHVQACFAPALWRTAWHPDLRGVQRAVCATRLSTPDG